MGTLNAHNNAKRAVGNLEGKEGCSFSCKEKRSWAI